MRFLDLAVILAYLIAITWFGARFRKGQSSLGDYFPVSYTHLLR